MTEYFVSYYDPEKGTIETYMVDARVFKGVQKNMHLEYHISNDQPVDDEFARRFGASALLWFATQYPELRAFFRLTDGKGNKAKLWR